MDHCGTETLQPTSQFKMADRLTQLPLACLAEDCPNLAHATKRWGVGGYCKQKLIKKSVTAYTRAIRRFEFRIKNK